LFYWVGLTSEQACSSNEVLINMAQMDRQAVPASEYDPGRISALLRSELSELWKCFDSIPLSQDQELRGSLISWFCVFTPELVDDECRALLHTFYEKAVRQPNHDAEGWYRTLPIELSLYGLSRDQSWLRNHKQNFAYGGSGLRCYVMESLSLVAPDLSIDDQGLVDRVKHNLKVVHGACEWGVAMLMVGKGQRSEKIRLLTEWSTEFWLNPHEKNVLTDLATQGSVPNRYFLPHYFRIQSYVIQRLSMLQPDHLPQLTAPSFAGSIFDQVGRHPLMQAAIQLPA